MFGKLVEFYGGRDVGSREVDGRILVVHAE